MHFNVGGLTIKVNKDSSEFTICIAGEDVKLSRGQIHSLIRELQLELQRG